MPHINVTVSGTTDPTLSARIAQRITELTRAHLQKDPAVTAVAITFIAPENWFIGGRSLASQSTNSFWLDIKSPREPIPRCKWQLIWTQCFARC